MLGEQLAARDDLGNGVLTVDSRVPNNALYFSVNVMGLLPSTPGPADASLKFTFLSPASDESVSGGYYFFGDADAGLFFLDHSRVRGFDNPFFTDKFSTSVLPRTDGTWTLEGVVDRSIIEVFLDGGVQSATMTFFAERPLTVMRLETVGMPDGVGVAVAVHALKSVWN